MECLTFRKEANFSQTPMNHWTASEVWLNDLSIPREASVRRERSRLDETLLGMLRADFQNLMRGSIRSYF
ncbi:hypothetical protein N9194_01690 [bacterium]|nr:hypothetical protein [bacterium]